MKPYLVSGTASFMAVAGQNLFYHYSQAKSTDDHILSSIFSKIIHIELFYEKEFHKLFNRLLIHETVAKPKEEEFIKHYVNYLIFESKRVPRKFISLIRQELSWQEDKSYLPIDESKEESFKKYSQIIEILNEINDEIKEKFKGATRDYFYMQLLIKTKKIIAMSDFNEVEIARQEKKDAPFMESVKRDLERYTNSLIAELIDKKLIKPLSGSGEKSFSLLFEPIPDRFSGIISHEDLLQDLDAFKIFIPLIYQDLVNSSADFPRDSSRFEMVSKLTEIGAVPIEWRTNDDLIKIMNNDEIEFQSLEKVLNDSQINFYRLHQNLFKFFGKQKALNYFKDLGYAMETDDKISENGSDFLISNKEKIYLNLSFDFRYRKKLESSDLPGHLNSLPEIRYFKQNESISFYFLIIFIDQKKVNSEEFQREFFEGLNSIENSELLKERIKFIPISTNNLQFIEHEFREFKEEFIQQDIDHSFRNQIPPKSQPERNDHFLDRPPFEFKKYDFEIEIKPIDTQIWRFGFIFSSTEEFPPPEKPRHGDRNCAIVHLNVGEPHSDGSGENPDQMKLNMYMPDRDRQEEQISPNYKGQTVFLSMKSNQEDTTFRIELKEEELREEKGLVDVNLTKFRFCKIFAWCEHIQFQLDTKIVVTRRVY